METENVSDRSNNTFVSIGLRNVMDRYGTDQKAIRYVFLCLLTLENQCIIL